MTKAQVDCDGNERLVNVKDAFYVKNTDKLKDKKILLIDDVLTTGSTLNECAKAIKHVKPKAIYGLTVARSVH